jgi:3-phosphoshikimate 1-carboxyvinyltransferase
MQFKGKAGSFGSKIISDIPGDKSISHRAVIIGSLATNNSRFKGFLCAEDCLNTAKIFEQLGVSVQVDISTKELHIQGVGLRGLKKPLGDLYVGNSGTGIRLIAGVLAGQSFSSVILGDHSIQKRPMSRIVDPLRLMGADIRGENQDGKIYSPLKIQGQKTLQAIHYRLPMPSAQVKSALLLASLFAEGVTTIHEPIACRNHSEVMLKQFSADLHVEGEIISCSSKNSLENPFSSSIQIPSDFSSAAFFIVLALLQPNSELCLKHIGLNPTRSRLLDILRRMGADIRVENESNEIESYGDIIVRSSQLHNVELREDDIAIVIDEIPILAVAGLFASGHLIVRHAEELRVKESDRIKSIVHLAQAFGASIEEFEDGFSLAGGIHPNQPIIQTNYDHRIAMSAIIAASIAGCTIELDSIDSIHTSFPNFMTCLQQLGI